MRRRAAARRARSPSLAAPPPRPPRARSSRRSTTRRPTTATTAGARRDVTIKARRDRHVALRRHELAHNVKSTSANWSFRNGHARRGASRPSPTRSPRRGHVHVRLRVPRDTMTGQVTVGQPAAAAPAAAERAAVAERSAAAGGARASATRRGRGSPACGRRRSATARACASACPSARVSACASSSPGSRSRPRARTFRAGTAPPDGPRPADARPLPGRGLRARPGGQPLARQARARDRPLSFAASALAG